MIDSPPARPTVLAEAVNAWPDHDDERDTVEGMKVTNVTVMVDGLPRHHLRYTERVRSTYRWHHLESGDHGDLEAPGDLDEATLVTWLLGDWAAKSRGV